MQTPLSEEARRAARKETFSQVNKKIDTQTKRMAGAALIAALAPGAMSLVDNQEESFGGALASGALMAAGLGAGGAIGYQQGLVTPEERETFIHNELEKIKVNMKEISKKEGAAAGIEYFAKAKQALLEDIDPVLKGPRAEAFNNYVQRMDPTGVIGELKIGNRTPRELRRMGRGAAIGGAAALIPAYALLRGGEIEE